MNIIIVNGFDTYEHRVDLLFKFFTDKGHNVRVLTSNFRHFEKTKRAEEKTGYQFFEAKPYYKNLSYQRLKSHILLSKDIFCYLDTINDKIDILWVLIPPNSFAKDAADYKKRHNTTKLIFDLIDLWPETMPIGSMKKYFPFTIWRNLRDKNLKYADSIFTECDLYRNKLANVLCGIETQTLYLARPLIPYEPHLDLPDERINLCYLGSINNIIDIDAVAKIIFNFKKRQSVELHIVGDGERKDELIAAVKKVGASVVFHGKIYDRTEKQKIFDSCHYGLNIMKQSVCVGLTMKSMDYLEFGLPIINNIKGDTWIAVDQYAIGINMEKYDEDDFEHYSIQKRLNARSFFENNLSERVFEDKLLSIIDEIKE